MFIKRINLSTIENLIAELQKLPPQASVYVNGTEGYMHVGTDCVCFDDSLLTVEYEDEA